MIAAVDIDVASRAARAMVRSGRTWIIDGWMPDDRQLRYGISRRDIDVIVIDDVYRRLGVSPLAHDGTVHRRIDPLTRIAHRHDVAIVLVGRLRRARHPLCPAYRVYGSAVWAEIPRVIIAVDADGNGYYLRQLKNCLGPLDPETRQLDVAMGAIA